MLMVLAPLLPWVLPVLLISSIRVEDIVLMGYAVPLLVGLGTNALVPQIAAMSQVPVLHSNPSSV